MVNPRDKLRLSKLTILVVDDDRAIAHLVRDVLKRMGFGTVIAVYDGEEAIHALQQNPIDLMIVDWEMSPLSGVEMTRRIRALESHKRFVPIIMLTGHGEKHEIEQARDCGITEYLIKPFSAKTLCSRLSIVADAPRSFIQSKRYAGPSRRRRDGDAPAGEERRTRRTRPRKIPPRT